MQQLWEPKVVWDDPVPSHIGEAWIQWKRSELPLLSQRCISHCYFDTKSQPHSMEIHGFSDASESDIWCSSVYTYYRSDLKCSNLIGDIKNQSY